MRWIEVDDGIVVYDGSTGRFADLNESAAELWRVLNAADWDEEAARHHLTDVHAVPPSEAQVIVRSLLADLDRSLRAST